MNRNRSYYRKQRKRVIRRKERILLRLGGEEYLKGWAHGAVGRFAKGKIHCSCPLCRLKSYEYPRRRDLRKADAADLQLREIETADQAKE